MYCPQHVAHPRPQLASREVLRRDDHALSCLWAPEWGPATWYSTTLATKGTHLWCLEPQLQKVLENGKECIQVITLNNFIADGTSLLGNNLFNFVAARTHIVNEETLKGVSPLALYLMDI